MKTGVSHSSKFLGGNPSKQGHYKRGRDIKNVLRHEIDGYCKCGYLTLKPNSSFEEHNGGLTVKRIDVTIIDVLTGNVVKTLRPKYDKPTDEDDIMLFYSCNACVNDWK